MTEARTDARAPLTLIAPHTIRLERTFDAPIEKVWRYLTEAELRRLWFMAGTDACPNGEFQLVIDHDNLSDDEVPYPESYASSKGKTWTEQVLKFDPPRLLETTFQGGKGGTVTYELTAAGNGTRLVLIHSGFTSDSGAQDFGSGWTSHLAVLAEKLAGRSVADFWALHARSREAVTKALA